VEDPNPYAPPQSNPEVSTTVAAMPLWNPDAAGAWSLLFTPVFGSILLLKNWRAMGRDDKLTSARVWLIISIIMFLPTFLVGGIGFIYLIIWYFAWQRPQTRYVKSQWGKEYPRKSWKKPLLIAFGCWGGLILSLLAIIGVLDSV